MYTVLFSLSTWKVASFWAVLLLFNLWIFCEGRGNRVLLRDISTLTFNRGQFTNARRSKSIPQLNCVGGSAIRAKKYQPLVVQCYNRGFDGNDVQWKCDAELSRKVFLGRVRVNCEGYEYPEDSYVLAGSCGLEYELEYADGGTHGDKSFSHRLISSPDHVKYASMLGLLAVAALIWYFCLSNPRDYRTLPDSHEEYQSTRFPPAGDPPPYEDAMRDRPPPYEGMWGSERPEPSAPSYGWGNLFGGADHPPPSSVPSPSQPYPSRPDSRGPRKTSTSHTESEPGSWLTYGLAAGAGLLGGYLLRSATNNSSSQYNTPSERPYPSRTYATFTEPRRRRSPSPSSDDDNRYTSSSFGGTLRR